MQATVTSIGGVVNTGGCAGLTVMILVCVIVLLHASVNVHVSVTLPPHSPGIALSVEVTDPEIRQEPVAELV